MYHGEAYILIKNHKNTYTFKDNFIDNDIHWSYFFISIKRASNCESNDIKIKYLNRLLYFIIMKMFDINKQEIKFLLLIITFRNFKVIKC